MRALLDPHQRAEHESALRFAVGRRLHRFPALLLLVTIMLNYLFKELISIILGESVMETRHDNHGNNQNKDITPGQETGRKYESAVVSRLGHFLPRLAPCNTNYN